MVSCHVEAFDIPWPEQQLLQTILSAFYESEDFVVRPKPWKPHYAIVSE